MRNSALLCVSLISIALQGTRRRVPVHTKTIAIVQGAKLGDMVCTTPLFRAIKNTFPDCRLIIVGDAVNKKLLEGHPAVDAYIVWHKNFSLVSRALRQESIDYGVVALPSFESLVLLVCGGARAIAVPKVVGGASSFETRLYRLLRRAVRTVPHYWGGYTPREYLRLVEPLGIHSDHTKKWLTFSDTAHAHIEQFFAARTIKPSEDFLVGMMSAVGGNPRKRWAPEKFARVADYLTEKYGARVVLVGAGSNAPDTTAFWNAMQPTTRARAINTLNQFSLDEAKALIATLSLFISADTGPIYIAEAFAVPTIDIVGPMDENAQPPQGEFHRVVVPPRDKPAFNLLNHDGNNPEEELRQARATTVEMVTTVIDELVPQLLKHKAKHLS